MRWWHRWRHGLPMAGDVYPPKSCWKPGMGVTGDITCPCGRVWTVQYFVMQTKDETKKKKRPWWDRYGFFTGPSVPK